MYINHCAIHNLTNSTLLPPPKAWLVLTTYSASNHRIEPLYRILERYDNCSDWTANYNNIIIVHITTREHCRTLWDRLQRQCLIQPWTTCTLMWFHDNVRHTTQLEYLIWLEVMLPPVHWNRDLAWETVENVLCNAINTFHVNVCLKTSNHFRVSHSSTS